MLISTILLGPDPQIYLVSLINALIKGVCLLLVGSLSDALGRRHFVVAGQAFGLVGSVIAATAKTVPTIVGANVLIGPSRFHASAVSTAITGDRSQQISRPWSGFHYPYRLPNSRPRSGVR